MDLGLEDLRVTGLGGRAILAGISTELATGQLVAILGPPGGGKSTLLAAIAGTLPAGFQRSGVLRSGSLDLSAESGPALARRGIRCVRPAPPEQPKRRLREQLWARAVLGGVEERRVPDWIDRLAASFPHLARRLDQTIANLSDGEQRIVSLVLDLAARPNLLAIDGITEGISPLSLPALLAGLRDYARDRPALILVADGNSPAVAREADRILVLHQGRAAFDGTPMDLKRDPAARHLLGFDQPRLHFGRAPGRLD